MKHLFRAAWLLWIANEVRGVVLAAPVFWGMYEAGGTFMAVWLGLCSLFGIAVSVFAPMFVARFIRRRVNARSILSSAGNQ